MIAQSSNCVLLINKKFIEADVAEVLGFTIDEFREYVRFLSYECELLINLDGVISSQIVRDTYSEVTKQRLAARERKIKKMSENETSPLILFNKT